MTTQAPAPTLGQFIDADTVVDLPVNYYVARLTPDGARRVVDYTVALSFYTLEDALERLLAWAEGDPIVFWGTFDRDLQTALNRAPENGWYLPYPPTDGIAILPVEDPPNQIPHQQDFLNHCCTFAHELLVDHQPHSSRLRHVDSWNLAPDLALDVRSIEKNRVGMRYYRAVLGYYYDKIVRFSSHPNNPADVGIFDKDWRTELAEMQALDRYICGQCRDEAGGSRLRDFIEYCNVALFDIEMDATEQLAIGSDIQYRARLPKIDRSSPDDLRPHPTQNVRTWNINVPDVTNSYRSMQRGFNAAVKRYDRDTSVRMPSGTHVPS